MMIPEFTIDPEFEAWLPKISDEERQALEADLLKNGCRDKLVIWREWNILIDGHNRHEICTAHDIPFETTDLSFTGRDAVKLWMASNQLARRNVTDFQRAELALLMKPLIEAKAKNRQAAGGGNKRVKTPEALQELFPEPVNGQTRDELGKLAGVSGKTINKVEVILQSGDAELVEQARSNKISISKAHQAVKEPKPDAKTEGGWMQLKSETLTRVAAYCRRNVAACPTVLKDLRELATSIKGIRTKDLNTKKLKRTLAAGEGHHIPKDELDASLPSRLEDRLNGESAAESTGGEETPTEGIV